MHALLNIADTGALESTAHMLEQIGYECFRPDPQLLEVIRWKARLEGVYSVEELVKDWGYSQPTVNKLAKLEDIDKVDLFVDVKGHINYNRIVSYWSRLTNRVLWCCLNGGNPLRREESHWADPPCPVLTNNQWYKANTFEETSKLYPREIKGCPLFVPWYKRAYACYPPYPRGSGRNRAGIEEDPICLVHNVYKWGYGGLVDPLRSLGVRFYGINGCPDGVISNSEAMRKLATSKCMVHLKTGDTVAYAMAEAMSFSVPFVCTQFYIDETRLGELLTPGVTCLTFDPTDRGESLGKVLDSLGNEAYNKQIGEAGKSRYLELAWDAARDSQGFAEFIGRCFP